MTLRTASAFGSLKTSTGAIFAVFDGSGGGSVVPASGFFSPLVWASASSADFAVSPLVTSFCCPADGFVVAGG